MREECKAALQEVYDMVSDIEGIESIDGRSHRIHYDANVVTLTKIVDRLTEVIGTPSSDHPLLGSIEWTVRLGLVVHVDKANSTVGSGTYHSICVFTHNRLTGQPYV